MTPYSPWPFRPHHQRRLAGASAPGCRRARVQDGEVGGGPCSRYLWAAGERGAPQRRPPLQGDLARRCGARRPPGATSPRRGGTEGVPHLARPFGLPKYHALSSLQGTKGRDCMTPAIEE
eukprot:scaffold269_cov404-Prasinococcus_capsulatus_cf.AAC.43